MEKSNPFISVDYWITKCNVFIDSTYKYGKRDYMYEKEIETAKNSYTKPIILIKTDLLPTYIFLLLDINFEFILITVSNDDHCVPTLYYPPKDDIYANNVLKLLDKQELLCWYTKNPGVNHDKLIGVPLGPKWQWKTTQFFGESKKKHLEIYNTHCLTPRENMLDTDLKEELLYLNFTTQTTGNPLYSPHRNMRNIAKTAFIKNGFTWNQNEPFEDYINTLRKYKFSVSPPGRGIDTHRTWESLMVGTIPIMISTTQDHLFKNLPVIIINNNEWESLTKEVLEKKYKTIINNINNYNFDILYTNYWDNLLH